MIKSWQSIITKKTIHQSEHPGDNFIAPAPHEKTYGWSQYLVLD